MKVAICDDDQRCREQIMEFSRAYSARNQHFSVSFSAFECADDLLEAAGKSGGFDVYLLDILMPRKNGLDLGHHLRQLGDSGKIIYLTSSPEYAIDAYQVNAFNYLLKPITSEAFSAAMDSALCSLAQRREKSLIVKTSEGTIRLPLDSILYAEMDKRTVLYHLTGEKTVKSLHIRTTFAKAINDLLRDNRFVLCGASVAANMYYIAMVEKGALLFTDGSKVYIPRKVCSDVRTRWADFWFEGDGNA